MIAAVPKQSNAANVLMSANVPAPPDGSKPAMESTTFMTLSNLKCNGQSMKQKRLVVSVLENTLSCESVKAVIP